MPKGKKGKGGKKKRRGKKGDDVEKRKLEFKEEGQEYARVLKMLGDGRIEGRCSDGEVRVCHIRGKMRKRVWINPGDLILVDIRQYQQDKADVVYKYNEDEARTLQSYGELTDGTAKEDQEKDEDRVIRFNDLLDEEDIWQNLSESTEEKESSESESSEEKSQDLDALLQEL